MGVPVNNGVAAGKRLLETCSSPERGTGIVHQADTHPGDLNHAAKRQPLSQRNLVHVPSDCLDRRQLLQLVEHGRGDHVTRVHDEIGALEAAEAPGWQRSAAAYMRVRKADDPDRSHGGIVARRVLFPLLVATLALLPAACGGNKAQTIKTAPTSTFAMPVETIVIRAYFVRDGKLAAVEERPFTRSRPVRRRSERWP